MASQLDYATSNFNAMSNQIVDRILKGLLKNQKIQGIESYKFVGDSKFFIMTKREVINVIINVTCEIRMGKLHTSSK